MMARVKKGFGLIAISLMLLFVTACGSAVDNSETSPKQGGKNVASESAKAEENVSLRFVGSSVQGSAEEVAINEIIKRFSEKYPHIKVVYETIPYDSFMEKLTAQVIGDRTPDIGILLDRWATTMIAQKALLPLNDYLPSDYKQNFVKALWNFGSVGEQAYAIPMYANVQALLYNKDLLEKAGVQVPGKLEDAWSYDEVVDVARVVKEKTGIKYGFAHWALSTPSRLSQYLVAEGGSVLTSDFKEPNLDNEIGIEMLRKIQNAFKDGIAPQDNWTATGDPNPALVKFVNQELAMYTGATNTSGIFLTESVGDKFKWGFTYMPTTLGTPTEVVAFNNTKHPEEVVKFMTFMAEPDNMAYFVGLRGAIPTRTDIPTDQIQYAVAPEAMSVLLEQIKASSVQIHGEMKHPAWSEIDMMLRKKLELLSVGQLTPEQAAKEGSDEIRKVLENYK